MREYVIPIASFFGSMYILGQLPLFDSMRPLTFWRVFIYIIFLLAIGVILNLWLCFIHSILGEWRHNKESFGEFYDKNFSSTYIVSILALIPVFIIMLYIGNTFSFGS